MPVSGRGALTWDTGGCWPHPPYEGRWVVCGVLAMAPPSPGCKPHILGDPAPSSPALSSHTRNFSGGVCGTLRVSEPARALPSVTHSPVDKGRRVHAGQPRPVSSRPRWQCGREHPQGGLSGCGVLTGSPPLMAPPAGPSPAPPPCAGSGSCEQMPAAVGLMHLSVVQF